MKYAIIIPDSAEAVVENAASELGWYLEQAAGINAPCQHESDWKNTPDTRCFYLDKTKFAQAHGLIPTDEETNSYGFRMKTVGCAAVICGSRGRGTLYGVYDYIETVLGVRFVTSDETYIPKGDKEVFPIADKLDVPDFELRSYLIEEAIDSPAFAAHKRMNTVHCESLPRYGGSLDEDFFDERHNTLLLVEPARWQESHPEFFAITDGRVDDICWTNGLDDDGNLDESMPLSVAKLLIEGIKKRAVEHPTSKYFMIGQTDTVGGYCHCARCTRVREKYGAESAVIVRMLNAVAREISAWAKGLGREIKLATFAYGYSERPPVLYDDAGRPYPADDSVICHPDVYIRYAAMSQNAAYAANDVRQGVYYTNLQGWRCVTRHFMFWEYANNFIEFLWYYPTLLHINETCRYYKEIGGAYVMLQGQHFNCINFTEKLRCYVVSKVLWNNNADPYALADEYMRLYYKDAYVAVKQVFELFEENARVMAEKYDDFGVHMLLHNYAADQNPRFYPLELFEKSFAILDDAEKSFADRAKLDLEAAKILRRVKEVRLVPMKMLLFNYRYYYGERGEKEFVREFCERCVELGVNQLSEGEGGELKENGIRYGYPVSKLVRFYGLA